MGQSLYLHIQLKGVELPIQDVVSDRRPEDVVSYKIDLQDRQLEDVTCYEINLHKVIDDLSALAMAKLPVEFTSRVKEEFAKIRS